LNPGLQDFAVICVTIVSLLVPPLFWDSVTGLGWMGVFLLLLLLFAKIFLKVEIFFSIDPLQHQVQKARKLLPHKLVPNPLGDKKEESSFVQAHLQGLVEICIWA